MYAIVENNQPRAASPAAVKAHVEAQLGGQHPVSVIRQWTEAYRNELGVYTVVVTKAALLDYQTHQQQPLALANGKVTQAYTAVDVDLDVAKEQAREVLADKRYEVETGGITVNGTLVKTDRETQAILTAARTRALEDANFSVDWKISNGVFATLDAATIIAIANAVADHVQACFSNEKALDALIEAAADVDAVRAVDIQSGW